MRNLVFFLSTNLNIFGDHCCIGCLQINYNNVETTDNDRLNLRREKVWTNEQLVLVTISFFLFSFTLLVFDPFWWLLGLLLEYISICVWIYLVCRVLYSVCVLCILFVDVLRKRIWIRVNISGVLWVLHGESQCRCWARWLRWWSSCHPPKITSRETTNTNWDQQHWPIPQIMIR